MAFFSGSNPDDMARLWQMMGPQHVDQQIRGAIQFCWMMLPPERQTPDEVESQIRRIVDRAIKDFREDRESFCGPNTTE